MSAAVSPPPPLVRQRTAADRVPAEGRAKGSGRPGTAPFTETPPHRARGHLEPAARRFLWQRSPLCSKPRPTGRGKQSQAAQLWARKVLLHRPLGPTWGSGSGQAGAAGGRGCPGGGRPAAGAAAPDSGGGVGVGGPRGRAPHRRPDSAGAQSDARPAAAARRAGSDSGSLSRSGCLGLPALQGFPFAGWASRRSPAPPPPRVGLAGTPRAAVLARRLAGGGRGHRAPALAKFAALHPEAARDLRSPPPGRRPSPRSPLPAPARAYLEPAPAASAAGAAAAPTARGPG